MTHSNNHSLDCNIITVYNYFAHEQSPAPLQTFVGDLSCQIGFYLDYICLLSLHEKEYLRGVSGEQYQLLAFIGGSLTDRAIMFFLRNSQTSIMIAHYNIHSGICEERESFRAIRMERTFSSENLLFLFSKVIAHFGLDLLDN